MKIFDALVYSFRENIWFVESFFVFIFTWFFVVLWKRLSKQLVAKAQRNSQIYSLVFWSASKKPIIWMIIFIGSLSACMIPAAKLSPELFSYLSVIRKCVTFWLVTWILLRVSSGIDHKNISGELGFHNRTRVTTIITIVRLLLFFTLFMLVLQSMGYSLKGLVTFGSVGAIVIGFASRTWIENALGYATIRVNKKFELGDWIIVDEISVEGMVESMSLSSTNVRDVQKRVVSIPNGLFLSKHVANLSTLTHRHVKIELPFSIADREVLLSTLKAIKKILQKDERVDQNQRILCNILHYDAQNGHLVAIIDCYLKCTLLEQYYSEKESLLMMILGVVNRVDLPIALRKVESVENLYGS